MFPARFFVMMPSERPTRTQEIELNRGVTDKNVVIRDDRSGKRGMAAGRRLEIGADERVMDFVERAPSPLAAPDEAHKLPLGERYVALDRSTEVTEDFFQGSGSYSEGASNGRFLQRRKLLCTMLKSDQGPDQWKEPRNMGLCTHTLTSQ